MSLIPRMMSAIHIGLFRMTGGRLGGKMFGAGVLLLTTIGGKTGKRRTTPLLYGSDGDRLIIIASKGGAPDDPAWYRNLTKNPEVEVEIGKDRRSLRAHTATAEEKPRLWALMVKMYAGYDGYQRKTSREIPVVVLEPAPR